VNLEEGVTGSFGHSGYMALGVGFFAAMTFILYKVATGRKK
jgi:hypothetical protein